MQDLRAGDVVTWLIHGRAPIMDSTTSPHADDSRGTAHAGIGTRLEVDAQARRSRTIGAVISVTTRIPRRSRWAAWIELWIAIGAASCGATIKHDVYPAATGTERAAVVARLNQERVTTSTFPRTVVYSWTKDAGARWLSTVDPPRLLRVQIRKHPPDDAFYDVHLRTSTDDAMRSLLTSPPFDHVRYAWTNVWGACDGLDDERYGDQLVRVELRDDALFAVFVPRTDDGANGAVSDDNPYRFHAPEWSFVDVHGSPVKREDFFAHRDRLAAVYHHSPARRDGVWQGLREVVLVNERAIAAWSIGDAAVLSALDDAATLVRHVQQLELVPRRNDDLDFASRLLVEVEGHALAPSMDAERAWLLTLPFWRTQYRDVDRLADVLERARSSQRFHRVVAAPLEP